MASKQTQGTSSPSASSLRLPLLGRRSRRGSLASLSSRSQVDRATLAQALDQIHSSASQSETLTTFDEFASPPPASTGSEGKSFAGDLVHGGLSGLYNRIRHSVSGSREANVRPVSGTGNESADESSVKSVKGRAVARPPKKPGTAVSSPNLVSTPVSRLQSPLSTTVADSRDNTTEPSEPPGIMATPRAPTVGYSPPSSLLPTTENSIASATSVEPLNLDMKDGAPLHFAATKSHSRGDAGVG
ncbi:Mitochondrial distribution and morphology protein 12, partial [Cryomyces antarcticus]